MSYWQGQPRGFDAGRCTQSEAEAARGEGRLVFAHGPGPRPVRVVCLPAWHCIQCGGEGSRWASPRGIDVQIKVAVSRLDSRS